eukprot:m51a1_g7567 putative wd40 repeat-containing protein (405) ;mRNA; f:165051-166458
MRTPVPVRLRAPATPASPPPLRLPPTPGPRAAPAPEPAARGTDATAPWRARFEAFALGTHHRVGGSSPVSLLSQHLFSLIVGIARPRRVVSGSWDGSLRVWELETRMCWRDLRGHTDAVRSVCSHGRLVASASHDCTVRLWDAPSGECLRVLSGHSHWVTCAAFLPLASGDLGLASCSRDRSLVVWRVPSGDVLCRVADAHEWAVWCLAPVVDAGAVITGGGDNVLRVWDVSTGRKISADLVGHSAPVTCVRVLSATRAVSAAGALDPALRLWDLADGSCLARFGSLALDISLSHEAHVWPSYFRLPDANDDICVGVVTALADCSVRVWRPRENNELCPETAVPFTAVQPNAVAVLDDGAGTRVVTGGEDGAIRLWDPAGAKIAEFRGSQAKITALAVTEFVGC